MPSKIQKKLINIYQGDDKLLFSNICMAATFFSRFRGLMFYRHWPPDFNGLWLKPCNSVHMFWMWFPLDLIYLNQGEVIVAVIPKILPNQIGPTIREATSVLELPVGSIANSQVKVGERLFFKQQ